MKIFQKSIFAILLSVILGSCSNFFDQVVTIDPPEYEKKMVLNCYQSQADSSIYVSVTRNVGVLETIPDSAYNVHGAKVEWLESGSVVHTMTIDTFLHSPYQYYGFAWQYYGKTTGAPVVTPGKQYEIRVTHPDFPSISAVQIAPFPPNIDTITVKLDTTNTGGFFDGTATFSITINDPQTERNFYEIYIKGDTYEFRLSSDDPNARQGLNDNRMVVSDDFFNGKHYILRVSNSAVFEDSWTVVVRSVTEDFYKFSSTARLNSETQYNPFANPVQVHSNVTGGLGIFSIAGETTVKVPR